MNENKKRINLIDIGVILIVLLFILGIGVRFVYSKTKAAKDTVTIEYTVKIENIRQYTLDVLTKSDILTDRESKEELGKIISMSEPEPYAPESTTLDGGFTKSPQPGKFKTTVTLRSDAKKIKNRYFLNDEIEVGTGRDFSVITKYVQTNGQIISFKEVPSENSK